MGSHPLNLGLRFLLEITALVVSGMWGWKQQEGELKYLLALGIPILLAAIWGTFAVPEDPSRSGAAPVVTPGIIRLIIELGIFGFATWAMFQLSWSKVWWIFGSIVVLHYLISYDRIIWLIGKQ